MGIFKDVLRFAFGTVTVLYACFSLCNIFSNAVSPYYVIYTLFFLHIPTLSILIIALIYNYLVKRVFWSLFKVEFWFSIISIIALLVCWVTFLICHTCSH